MEIINKFIVGESSVQPHALARYNVGARCACVAGYKQGIYISTYHNIGRYLDDQMHGQQYEFYTSDRRISFIYNYHHGKLHLEQSEWYYSGQLREICTYNYGLKNGKRHVLSTDGQTITKEFYSNDVLDGICTYAYFTGHIKKIYVRGIEVK